MKIHQVRWCTLIKLEIRFQYVTSTLQYVGTLYTLSYDKVVPKLCTVLYVCHKFDVRYM